MRLPLPKSKTRSLCIFCFSPPHRLVRQAPVPPAKTAEFAVIACYRCAGFIENLFDDAEVTMYYNQPTKKEIKAAVKAADRVLKEGAKWQD